MPPGVAISDPETESVFYTEWGPEALDIAVVPPSCPNPKFPVNARALHTYMQIGKDFYQLDQGPHRKVSIR
jgi:hypothetical protein